jgi:hypothetical protein
MNASFKQNNLRSRLLIFDIVSALERIYLDTYYELAKYRQAVNPKEGVKVIEQAKSLQFCNIISSTSYNSFKSWS